MKFSVSVLVLLWCVAVKSDNKINELHYGDEQIIENEIQSEVEKGAETSVSSEEICKPDIHTVLRELSTKLAEQTVELKYTKKQMEELKRQNEAAEIRLKASEAQVEELKKQNEVSESRLEELKREYGDQALELRTLQMRSNITEGHVRELRKENTYESNCNKEFQKKLNNKIAFSASISAQSSTIIGPFNTEITLKYANIYVNNGNAYNPNTGIFTAPVRGVYMFRFSISGRGSSSNAVAARLFKNNQEMVMAWVHQPSHFASSTNGASLLLEVGDVVCVRLFRNTHIYDDQDHYNTFSGQLLFTV